MERLTYRRENGRPGIIGAADEIELDAHTCRCIWKLKDYEDTGLSPFEVIELKEQVAQFRRFERADCFRLLRKIAELQAEIRELKDKKIICKMSCQSGC